MSGEVLMVSVSGVRGIIGTSLTPEVVVRFVGAFAASVGGTRVVVGRDSRVSGPWIHQLVEVRVCVEGKEGEGRGRGGNGTTTSLLTSPQHKATLVAQGKVVLDVG